MPAHTHASDDGELAISFHDVSAAARLEGQAHRTPVMTSRSLTQMPG